MVVTNSLTSHYFDNAHYVGCVDRKEAKGYEKVFFVTCDNLLRRLE